MVIQATDKDGDLRGVVAIGASAGGVEALSKLAAGLSTDLPYAYLMALHMPPGAPSVLAQIVDRSGPLPAVTAENGASLEPARIYVARPDHHLLVADHRVALAQGTTQHGHAPAINALFRSVALEFGSRAVGVLLSGVLDDGVLGLEAIRSQGGTTIGQSPADALFPALPTSARDAGVLDQQAAAADIGEALRALSHREIQDPNIKDSKKKDPKEVVMRGLQEKAKLARQLAESVHPGRLRRRYTALAEETEVALAALDERPAAGGTRPDEAGDVDG